MFLDVTDNAGNKATANTTADHHGPLSRAHHATPSGAISFTELSRLGLESAGYAMK